MPRSLKSKPKTGLAGIVRVVLRDAERAISFDTLIERIPEEFRPDRETLHKCLRDFDRRCEIIRTRAKWIKLNPDFELHAARRKEAIVTILRAVSVSRNQEFTAADIARLADGPCASFVQRQIQKIRNDTIIRKVRTNIDGTGQTPVYRVVDNDELQTRIHRYT